MPPAYSPASLTPSGLALLLEAFDAAHDADCGPWDFAVEYRILLESGFTLTALRWLVRKEYGEHALELTLMGDEKRSLRPLKTLRFGKRSCFVLTPRGAEVFRQSGQPTQIENRTPERPISPKAPADNPLNPRWNAEFREFFAGATLLKRFHGHVRDQELVPASFEDDGWPAGIDNPLCGQPGKTALERLRAAVIGLNRWQKERCIHFSVDPSNERVHWEPAESRNSR